MQSAHPFFSDRKRCHRCKTLTHLKGEGCTYLCPLGFLKTAPAVAWNQINGRSVIRAHHRALVEPGQSPSKPNRKRHGTTAGSQSHRRTPTVQPTPRRIPWATRQREGPPRRVQRRRRVRPAAGAESTRGRRQRRRGPDSCRQGRPFGGRVSTPQATVSLARYLFLFRRMTRHDLQLGELDAASSCGLWRLELHFASPDANHEQCESKKNK